MADNDNNQQGGLAAAPGEDFELALRFKALDYALAGLPRGTMDGAEYLPDVAFDVLDFLKGTYDPDKYNKPVAEPEPPGDVIQFSKFREYLRDATDREQGNPDEPELPF